MRQPPTRRTRAAAVLLGAALALTACSGDADDTGDAAGATGSAAGSGSSQGTPSSTPAASDSESASPGRDAITAPGTRLPFGDQARVAYEPRRGRGTDLRLTVVGATKGRLTDFAGFDLTTPYQRNASYYYVRVRIRNAGPRAMGPAEVGPTGVAVWGVSEINRLLPPVEFRSSFQRCPTAQIPRRFRPGDVHRTCLVFLSPDHGQLAGVSYRPFDTYDPIVWDGKVAKPAPRGG